MSESKSQQKSITQFFKTNQKQYNCEKQQTSTATSHTTRPTTHTTQPTTAQTDGIKITELFHPPADYIFPKTKSGDKLRSCQPQWFEKFPWLHYDEK